MVSTALLTGCTASDTVLTRMASPAPETTPATAQGQVPALAAPPTLGAEPSTLATTRRQRAYLDALADAGIQPSSDLLALSIGSYICQARAAKQSEQAVWDYVLPLVRGDVGDADESSMAPQAAEVDAATAGYIRIAIERLC